MEIIEEVYSLIESNNFIKATRLIVKNIDLLLADEDNYYSLSWSLYRILKNSPPKKIEMRATLFALLEITRKENDKIKEEWVEKLFADDEFELREVYKIKKEELSTRITLLENEGIKEKSIDDEIISQFYMPDPRLEKDNKNDKKTEKKESKKLKKS